MCVGFDADSQSKLYSYGQLSTNNFDGIRSGMYEKLKVISRGASCTCTDCLKDVYHEILHTSRDPVPPEPLPAGIASLSADAQ